MKLVQKSLLNGSHSFEVINNHLRVISKKHFKTVSVKIPLIDINPDPLFSETGREIGFSQVHDNFELFSLLLNKPDSHSVEHFIAFLQQEIDKHCKILEQKKSTIKAYSQRLSPPFSGLVQIAESEFARALTMDGKTWEFQHLMQMLEHEHKPGQKYQRRHSHAFTVDNTGLKKLVDNAADSNIDDSLLKIAQFLDQADFPFRPTDQFECWLLDAEDQAPLAMLFSCSSEEEMSSFPDKTEWTALPAAAMPIEKTAQEIEDKIQPVNYRVEQMVRARAGYKPVAQWFKRQQGDNHLFPALLLREDWPDQNQANLCKRYLDRQASRLLMLQNLPHEDRKRLEIAAKANVFEVERFYPFYPEIIDQKLMNSILVEARLRNNTEANDPRSIQNRRDGVLYQ